MIDMASLAPQLPEYQDRWIAINGEDNKIIAVADTITDVKEKAIASGFDDAYLFRVPRFDVGFIPSMQIAA